MIRAVGIAKRYRSGAGVVDALRGVDLAIGRGEMVAVMGPSGCGKTTLLNCLSGLDTVDAGRILIDGQDLAAMPDTARTQLRARRMGFVFQVYNLLPVLSAVENVELPLLLDGVRPRVARLRAMAALETVNLGDRAGHRPSELSGGQRQRVAVARALVNDPAIVWADEPTGALDSASAAGILDLLHDLNRAAGLTLVVVTHDPAVGALCGRVIRLRDGAVVADGHEVPKPESAASAAA